MRKLLLSAAFGLLGISAIAQNYTNKFTHTSGTVNYNTANPPIFPISVTVTPIGTPGITVPGCGGTGPYYVSYSATTTSGYRYSFSPAATHVKFEIAEFHDDDTIFIRVNNPITGTGPITPITSKMISPYLNGDCPNPPTNAVQILKNGRIVAPFSGAGPIGPYHQGNNTLTLTVPAVGINYISSIELVHPRDSAQSTGIVYNAYAAFDTCEQPLFVTADSPICTKKNLNLHATYWPGATYTWTTTAAGGIPAGEVNKPDPVIPNLSITAPSSNGFYRVEVTRGACFYKDSISIDVELTPNNPITKQAGPKCTGDNDTLSATSSNNTDVFYFRPGSNVAIKAVLPPTFNQHVITNIQPADAGVWRVVVVSLRGCPSDTIDLPVALNSIVKADFNFKVGFSCGSDTVQFEDLSLGNTSWSWDFDDGSSILTGSNAAIHGNPLHIYSSQGTYNVKLVAFNSVCKDSITKQVPVNHPLTVDFDMYNDSARTILDDSICQGDTIFFRNNSAATPATIPFYTWDFKDGTPQTGEFEPKHKFVKYGVYDVYLKVRDYLGCEKTITKRLVVDSLGSASFFSDTVLCAGESLKFSGDYSLIGGTYALWDFSDGHTIQDEFTIDHAFEKPGIYDVKLEAHYRVCADTTYHQNIHVIAYPTVDLGADTAMCPNGAPIALKDLINNQSTPGLKWRWNTHTADTTPDVMIHHPGIYSVTVDNQGCATTDTIVVKKNCYVDIPNVFTPDGDGFNDYFFPRQFLSRNVSRFEMTIYNRWGEVVFETKTLNGRGWDGKLNDKDQPQGVYVYQIKVAFGNGTNENYQGNITLLR